MLLICSDSQPFYSHNYPQLSDDGNLRELEHQTKIQSHWLCRADNKQLGSLCFYVRIWTISNETDFLRQLWELDTDTEAPWTIRLSKCFNIRWIPLKQKQNTAWQKGGKKSIKKVENFLFSFHFGIFGKGKWFRFWQAKQLCHMQTLSHACVRIHTKDRLDTSACSRHCTPCVSCPAGSLSWQSATDFQKALVCVCGCVCVWEKERESMKERERTGCPGACTLLSSQWQSLMQL